MPAQHHRCASSQDIARYAAVDSVAPLGSLSLQVKAASMKQHMLWRVSLHQNSAVSPQLCGWSQSGSA